MKTKVIVLVALSAIVTLSFTFASVNAPEKKEVISSSATADAPAGGFATDDKF
jgi:hypothetical protein